MGWSYNSRGRNEKFIKNLTENLQRPGNRCEDNIKIVFRICEGVDRFKLTEDKHSGGILRTG
jgi:hypothetical protein